MPKLVESISCCWLDSMHRNLIGLRKKICEMLGENSPRKLFIFRSPTYLLKYRQSQVDQKRIRKENNHKETTPIIRWDPRGARYNHQSRIIFSFSRYESKGTTPSFIEKLPRLPQPSFSSILSPVRLLKGKHRQWGMPLPSFSLE